MTEYLFSVIHVCCMINYTVSKSDYMPRNYWIVGNTGLERLEYFNVRIPQILQKPLETLQNSRRHKRDTKQAPLNCKALR